MMKAEVVASDDSALIFSRISLRARSTAERLPSASARLPPVFAWIVHDDCEEAQLRRRHALVHALQRLIERPCPCRNVLDQALELGPSGAGLSRAMILQAVVHRQAGLDAAHDDVDGVGEVEGELLGAPLRQKTDHPARQTERGHETEQQGRPRRRAEEKGATGRPPRPTGCWRSRTASRVTFNPVCLSRAVQRQPSLLLLAVLLLQGLQHLLAPVAGVLLRELGPGGRLLRGGRRRRSPWPGA